MSLSRRKTSLGFFCTGRGEGEAQKTRMSYCLTRLYIQGAHCLMSNYWMLLKSWESRNSTALWSLGMLSIGLWTRSMALLSSRPAPLSLYSEPHRLAVILHFLFPTCAQQSAENTKKSRKILSVENWDWAMNFLLWYIHTTGLWELGDPGWVGKWNVHIFPVFTL